MCDSKHKRHTPTLRNIDCRYAKCRYAERRCAECHYGKHRYAECHYAERRYAEYRVLFYVMQNVIMLSVEFYFMLCRMSLC
jgi:hypothetical protein